MRSSSRPSIVSGTSFLGVAATALVVLACGLAGRGATQAPASPTPASPSEATPSPTPQPSPTIEPTTEASPPSTLDPADRPPDGILSAGSDDATGWLGTYCWASTCADAPQTPPKDSLPALEVDGQTTLSFILSDATSFYEWHASYAAASNGEQTPLGEGGADYDPYSSATPPPDLQKADFPAPPSGDWAVHVSLTFVAGDARYAWHVIVP
ncbi:MAG TPA: hypothetical protein VJK49_03405 [Candidatus Limnocylindrales bacterium]|nr:hypothetical protein [Candidatus Limnocylindrales bacterium]